MWLMIILQAFKHILLIDTLSSHFLCLICFLVRLKFKIIVEQGTLTYCNFTFSFNFHSGNHFALIKSSTSAMLSETIYSILSHLDKTRSCCNKINKMQFICAKVPDLLTIRFSYSSEIKFLEFHIIFLSLPALV